MESPKRENLRALGTSRPKWHLLYFALAAFDVVTISVSLYLNHRLVDIHTRSVQTDQEWAARLGRYSDLGESANQLNVAVNDVFKDVFKTGNVKEQSDLMHASLKLFEEQTAAARLDLKQNLGEPHSTMLLKHLEAASAAMKREVADANLIFEYIDRDKTRAGISMATMDRHNATLNTALGALRREVANIQAARFQQQEQTAVSLKKFEYGIAGAIVFMILGVTLYGHKLSKQVTASALATERHLAALSESEERIRAIVNTAVDGIVTIDERGIVESFNPAAEQIFGCTADEIIGQNVNRIVPSPDKERHDEYLARYLKTGETTVIGTGREVLAERWDGTKFPLLLALSDVRLADRHLFTGIVRDITEQKQVEADVRFQARKQAAVAELGQLALEGTDLSTLLTRATDLVAETLEVEFSMILEFHRDEDELLLCAGTGWNEGLVGQLVIDASQASEAGCELLSDEPVILADYQSNPHCKIPLFGDHRVESGISVIIPGPHGPFGVLGAFTTKSETFTAETSYFLRAVANVITSEIQREWAELQKRERDRVRAEQMSVVAQMATGVAHELRNPLTGIAMLVEKNREELESRGFPADDLRIIEEEIGRIDRSVTRFLSFARPSGPDCRPIRLHDLVERTFALIQVQAARQEVALIFSPPKDSVVVEADWEQIQQLLLNLALNAIDVMSEGGTLEVEVCPPVDGRVQLRVLDSGPGISRDVMAKLFEPFVTTKETGVGLGLVVSRRIAEDHGGTLTAKNRPEGGACFELSLPVAVEADRVELMEK